jgi:type IV secretion system protein VirB8
VITDQSLETYWQESSSWDADRAARAARSAHVAWWVAGAGWTCAMAASGALALLTPLKRVDPFVVRVDNTTGIVDVVPVYAGQGEAAEPVTRYLLAHYISVCERFNFATAESDYEECGAFHSAQRNQAWYALWNTANPASPLNVYKDGTTMHVEVTAVSFFHRASGLTDLAQVRYLKAKRTAESASGQVSHWVATIQYGYGEPSQEPKVRRWNPLGFRILDFHTEPEVQSGAPAASLAADTRPAEGTAPTGERTGAAP